jgi:hypothetical protein
MSWREPEAVRAQAERVLHAEAKLHATVNGIGKRRVELTVSAGQLNLVFRAPSFRKAYQAATTFLNRLEIDE